MAEVIEIPEQNFYALKDAVAKLNRKAAKIGSSKVHLMPIGTRELKDKESGRIAKIIEVYLTIPEMKIAGWTFVGNIDHRLHHETGRNVVFINPELDEVTPDTYWDTPSHCDHCKEQRKRNFTFILRNEAGELKQVGSSCLKDFLGHDPLKTLKLFEILRDAVRHAKSYRAGLSPASYFYINTIEYVANVIEVLKERGTWLGSQKARELSETSDKPVDSTGDLGLQRYFGSICVNPTHPRASEWAMDEARAMVEEVAQSQGTESLDQNLRTIANATLLDYRHTRMAAVIGFKWFQKQPKTQKVNEFAGSVHFLNVDDKFEGEVTVVSKRVIDNDWGSSTLVRMNYNGNLVITFAGGKFSPEVGSTLKIAGTVKSLGEFNGTKQTVLNRVRTKD